MTGAGRQDALWTLPLVSKTFRASFNELAATDIHVPTAKCSHALIRTLLSASPSAPPAIHAPYAAETAAALRKRSRTLTIYLDGDESLVDGVGPDACALGWLLHFATTLSTFPLLTQLNLVMSNYTLEAFHTDLRVLFVPSGITHLSISFLPAVQATPLASQPDPDVCRPSEYRRHGFTGWHTSSLQHLSVLGAPPALVDDLARSCPSLQTLELTWKGAEEPWWEQLAPLPAQVRALTVRVQGDRDETAFGLFRISHFLRTKDPLGVAVGAEGLVRKLVVELEECEEEEAVKSVVPPGWASACKQAHGRGVDVVARARS